MTSNHKLEMPLLAIALLMLPLLLWAFLHHRGHHKPGPKLPPGPRPIPIIGNLHMLGHLPHRALAKLAQKHGPIMSLRLGQVPTIVISSPQAVELFFKQHDAVFASRPTIQAYTYLSYGAKAMAFTPYGDYWRRVRKLCSLHLLSPAKVEGFEGLRRREVVATVQRLKEAAVAREVVDVGARVGELVRDIMFKMVVGKDKDDNRFDLVGVVEEALALEGAFNFADFVPFLGPLDLQGLTQRMKALSKVIDEILENIIEDHLKEEDFGENKDILGAMLALMNNPGDELLTSFDRDNIKAIMLDLFTAGIDAPAATITWALSALLKHPRVMKLLLEEFDTIIGRKRMVEECDLPKLSYLDMVVKETFRLYPVGPLLIPHESMNDVVIDGYMIPKKSRIFVNIWAIGHDPRVWGENVKEFYPERFMNNDINIRGGDFKLTPFGVGRRKCPGMQLGLTTVKIILAQLVHCFNWELPNGMHPEEVDMAERFGLTMPRASQLLALPSYRL